MKNIFIFAGSKSAKLADYVLIKKPHIFPLNIRYNMAIGRAIKTNWGNKSLQILTNQIQEQAKEGADVNRELGALLNKYSNVNLLTSNNDSSHNIIKIPRKFKFNKTLSKYQNEILLYEQIIDIIEKDQVEQNDEFLEAWLDKCLIKNDPILLNAINYLEVTTKIEADGYFLLRLAQAYALNMEIGKARDTYYKYTLFYNTTVSINYIIGNNNKIFINKLFQRGEALIAHPLLDNKVAADFFNNHDEFIKNYYTDTWKEALGIDYQLRKTLRENPAKKKFDSDKKVLFVTNANWNFLTILIEEFEHKHNNIDIHDYFSFSKKIKEQDKKLYSKALYSPLSIVAEEHDINIEYFKKLDPVFFEKLERADIVFCEWGNEAAVFLSRFAPPNTKIIVRIHSYEVFTFWHFFINLAGVDGFIFVAPHIKEAFLKNVSSNYYGYKMSSQIKVIPNIKDYSSIDTNKKNGSEFVLGLAGFNKINKGLIKALRIFNKLYSEDDRWRLRLAGNNFDIGSLDYSYWKNVCEPYILDNNLEEVVIFDGYQNISKWLKSVGFILSVSDREGTHEALVEGVSSGSIPLIIDWEMVKGFGGVKKLYPFLTDYTFDDMEDFALINTKILHEYYNTNRFELSQIMKGMHEPEKVVNNIYEFIGNIYET